MGRPFLSRARQSLDRLIDQMDLTTTSATQRIDETDGRTNRYSTPDIDMSTKTIIENCIQTNIFVRVGRS